MNNCTLTAGDALEYLANKVDGLPEPFQHLARLVIEDGRFQKAPGSSGHHHAFEGGLALHTAEVVWNCISLRGSPSAELITAAIWHDFCKVFEYEMATKPAPAPVPDGTTTTYVRKLPYRELIGHVVGSAMAFDAAARLAGLDDNPREDILHTMLAHHGRLEWRSPVEPKTEDAWTLHSADMLSARPNH